MTAAANRHIRFLVALAAAFLAVAPVCSAQDLKPEYVPPQTPLFSVGEAPESFVFSDPVNINTEMPRSFKNMGENVIHDDSLSLTPFFKKLSELKLGTYGKPLRIVHIGDSHVRGHAFPAVLKSSFERDFGTDAVKPEKLTYKSSGIAKETGLPGIVYNVVGVNGSTAQNFCDPVKIDEIASLKPDLIIISFGTNESFGRGYNSSVHKNQLDMLVRMLSQRCPGTCFLLTTPPGCYNRSRRGYTPNARVADAAGVIGRYAAEKGLACWDLYDVAGGRESACTNWTRNNLMQRDHVHFTYDGYTLMGNLLYAAIIKSFNKYVSR